MSATEWNALVFYYHPIFLEHLKNTRHPERPERLQLIQQYLVEKQIWDKLQLKEPKPAEAKWIETTHSREYIKYVQKSCKSAPAILDSGDTIVTKKSYEAALYAVGACLMGIDDLMLLGSKAVFCAVRPPGHHAEYEHAMGFCLFNNVAIAARYALHNYGINKVFILDWDVHHGNGTQNTFEFTEEVYFCSVHESPLYPGSGFISEIGKGRGEGYNLNIPLPPHSTDKDYLSVLDKRILPEIEKYQPELLIISAGFDAHDDDPLASMMLSTDCYFEMTEKLVNAMKNHGNKILSVLEGGYHLNHLADSVFAHLSALKKANRQ